EGGPSIRMGPVGQLYQTWLAAGRTYEGSSDEVVIYPRGCGSVGAGFDVGSVTWRWGIGRGKATLAASRLAAVEMMAPPSRRYVRGGMANAGRGAGFAMARRHWRLRRWLLSR